MEIGKKLKDLRTKRGESLQQVADAVGVSRTHIWELESGAKKVNPSFELIRKLADYFEVSVLYFIDGDPNTSKRNDPALLVFNNMKSLDYKDQKLVLEMVKTIKKRDK